MNSEILLEIIMKLNGQVNSVGESNSDEKRFENLKTLTDLHDKITREIYEASLTADRYEASMKKIGKYAKEYLQSLEDWIPEAEVQND